MSSTTDTLDRRLLGFAFGLLIILLYIFLLVPLVTIVGASFTASQSMEFPPRGWSLQWYVNFFERGELVNALMLSLRLALVTSLVTTVLAVMAALCGQAIAGRLAGWYQIFLTLPLLVPELLTAVGLLFFFHKVGLARSESGLQLSHILLSFPYAFVSVSAALRQVPQAVDEASASLGASPWQTLRYVILPLVVPGIAMGAIFAFINSFDLYTISLLLKPVGGSTLPLALFDFLTYEFKPTAAAAATLSIILSVIGVALIQRFVGLQRVF